MRAAKVGAFFTTYLICVKLKPMGATILLILAAITFAGITGANDGASLIALNLSSKSFPPLVGLVALTVAIVLGPFILGTAVATTLAVGLTKFSASSGGESALLAALGVTVAVMLFFTRLHLPSSVTQALTGSIIGIGLGLGLPVDGNTVARVILILIAAPLAAGLVGTLTAALFERLRTSGSMRHRLGRLQAYSFGAQCVAYAANDSQKMIAVCAIAFGLASHGHVDTTLPMQLLIGGAFFVGTCVGVAGLGGRLAKLLPAHPLHGISAGFASAPVVFISALAGSPVSMAQAQTSALVGAEVVINNYRRVRWQQASKIILVWFTTLPTAVVLAAVVGWLMR